MSGKRIRGITIEIGSDTVGLEKALSNVNKRSNALKTELRDVERLLKFDPGNVEALAQKQKLLSEQVATTAERLDTLKKAEKQVQDQVKEGKISEQQYRNFRREIEFTEGSIKSLKQELGKLNDGSALKDLKKDADKASDSVDDLGSSLGEVAAGLAAGGGIAGAISSALDSSSLDTSIEIGFEIPEQSKAAVKDAVRTVQAYGVDSEAALEGIRRQWVLNKTASDEVNGSIANGAATITRSYAGVDFVELIQEVSEISGELKTSDENALALVNTLLKAGFPPEQIDTIAEYGKQLSTAGYNAEEIQAIFAAGVDTKTWNIDNLLDGVKEGRIKMAEFGQEVPKAMTELLKGTDISAKQFQEWGKQVAAGGEGGSQAMQAVSQALIGVKDETKRNALGVQIFGTMWEDQGTNITDTILNAKNNVVDLKVGQDELNAATERLNSDPAVQLSQSFADMKTQLDPLLVSVADFVSQVATWIEENPKLAATITAITVVVGILIGLFVALVPLVGALATGAAALNIGMLPLTLTILAIAAVIAGLIGIGILLYKNWDTISAKASDMGSKFKGSINDMVDSGKKKMRELKEDFWEKVEAIKGFFSGLGDKLKFDIPKPKLPKFKVSGNFDLIPPDLSVPKVSVDWFKEGALFPANSPRLIGIGDHPTAEEAALPLTDAVLGKIAGMISEHMGVGGNVFNFERMFEGANFSVRSNEDIKQLAREIGNYLKSAARGKGVAM
jgi:phage-related minor tail protein